MSYNMVDTDCPAASYFGSVLYWIVSFTQQRLRPGFHPPPLHSFFANDAWNRSCASEATLSQATGVENGLRTILFH